MDDGFIASANTFKELLAKFGRSSAKYLYTGVYEFNEYNEDYGWTINVYRGADLAREQGYEINDNERNTWHLND